eukprot:7228756-Ditylum_brightwellii.AAC.1
MEGFTYATSLDLNMGYYCIEVSPASSALCTIVLTWGKSEMFANIEEVRVYIGNILLTTNELEYLGYWVTREGIKHLQKKVEAILKIAPPMTRKQLCSFIGMINYYCDMWQDLSKVLAQLAVLMSKGTPWKWTSVKQKAFDKAKKIVS